MKKPLLSIFIFLFYFNISAQEESKREKLPRFIALKTAHGTVLPTNDFVSGSDFIPYYSMNSLKYGISAKGDRWQDYAFGMPYMGIGMAATNYFRKNDLGIPVTIYLFQGGHMTDYDRKFTLNFEWKAGASFNWKHYDPFDNPDNIAIGSPVNIYAGVGLYGKWNLSPDFNLNAGVQFEHFSNGAYQYPNSGINQASAYVELLYYFNKESVDYQPEKYGYPAFEKKREHDVMFLISARHAKIDTLGTNLPEQYVQRRFVVLGGSYAYMFNNHYRYRWGPSLEISYDESAGVRAWREMHPTSHKMYDRIKYGDFWGRFSLGVSAKGEVKMPLYSAFLNIGYDIIHAKESDGRLYQIFGVKVFLRDNLFGVFGIRATNFGRSQYMYLNLGYTIGASPKKKCIAEPGASLSGF